MVNLRLGRRGASTLGCIFSVVLFLGALYYGVHIGGVYWRYYQMLDDMRQQARHADQLTDNAIQTHLTAQTVALPGFNHTFMLRPRAEEPL
jgi:hypothetical protein